MKEPVQRLRIDGRSNKCTYRFLVDGDVRKAESGESDSVKQTDAGMVIQGTVLADYSDTFELSREATLEKAAFDGNCAVSIDGQTIQLGALISTATAEDFRP